MEIPTLKCLKKHLEKVNKNFDIYLHYRMVRMVRNMILNIHMILNTIKQ